MAQDFQITATAKAIRVVYRGRAEYGVVTGMLRQVARLASQTQNNRLLFDFREAAGQYYYAETIRHAEDGPTLGIDHMFRIALLGSESDPMLKYFEDVAVNRGFDVKAFTIESTAVAWLQGEP
jgi:hypothetical protein